MQIYNSLSGKNEDLKPLHKNEVRMYVCGPTVYDEPHIGHIRSACVFDVVRRALSRHYKVRFVRNVTDVDDKIIERATAEDLSADTIAEKYLKAYHRDLKRLDIRPPDEEPRATKNIEDMLGMIRALLKSELAYESSGNVYFRVRKFSRYGELSHRNLDQMRENVRIEPGEGKEDALDFALWKKVDKKTLGWKSPWGHGRPGWHIECSAMSIKRLGAEFDIHGGGQDLLFPHHENERAQVMGATGKGFVRIWMHHGLVTVEGKKMSKSLKNYITLDQVLKRHSADALKLFFLQSHYRSGVDFSWKKMNECEQSIRQFKILFTQAQGLKSGPLCDDLKRDDEMFFKELSDDFNTPEALATIFQVRNKGNNALQKGKTGESLAGQCRDWLRQALSSLGLFGSGDSSADLLLRNKVDGILKVRDALRKKKNYKASDQVRDQLVQLGFDVGDAQSGSECLSIPAVLPKDMKLKLETIYRKAKALV